MVWTDMEMLQVLMGAHCFICSRLVTKEMENQAGDEQIRC
jgi:hypothetical protein